MSGKEGWLKMRDYKADAMAALEEYRIKKEVRKATDKFVGMPCDLKTFKQFETEIERLLREMRENGIW